MSRSEGPARPKLGSWKEIAQFLARDVRTVQRWEREGLPVHRHHHLQRSSVYAFPDELEDWWEQRGRQLKAPSSPRGPAARWLLAASLATAAGVGALWLANREHEPQVAPASLGEVIASGRPLVNPGSLAVSHDGATLYVNDWGAGTIFLLPAVGGTPTPLATGASTGFAGLDNGRLIELSRNGSELYVAGWGSRSVFAVSTSTGRVRVLASGPPFDRPHGLGLSSDGTVLYVADNYGGRLYRMPVEGGDPQLIAAGLLEPIDVVACGSSLYVTSGSGAIYRVALPKGEVTRVLAGRPLVPPSGIKLSPDRSTMFIVDDAGFGGHPPASVYALPVFGGALSRVFSGSPLLYPPDGAISPDGMRVDGGR